MIFLSTIIFGFVVVFFLFCIQQLIKQDIRLWTSSDTLEELHQGPGGTVYATLHVEEVGDVAVRIRLPEAPRYISGAPLIVYIPLFLTPDQKTFQELQGMSDAGVAQIALLLPGRKDRETDLSSEGEVDYGGEKSMAALRDVFLYAAGQKADSEGVYIQEKTSVPLNKTILGAYSFSHSGMLLFQTLARYGENIPLDFVVARENSTEASLAALEVGYFDKGSAVLNTYYTAATQYHDDGMTLSYEDIAWDAQDERPYFDVNGDNRARKDDDILLSSQILGMFGKKVYSPELLSALRTNGSFTDQTWPSDLATPEEAQEWWSIRESLPVFSEVAKKNPPLAVMMLFGKKDHAQPATDKPHIRQEYAGLTGGGLWVRLNPDSAYVAELDPLLAQDYFEHPAGTGPTSWETDAVAWAHPDGSGVVRVMPLAAIAEMADRTEYEQWSNNLSGVLLIP